MVKRNIPRKAQTFEKKAEKNRKAELQEKAIKKAETVVGEGNATLCNRCNKPKLPPILRTAEAEK
jgi:hypothetical protein